MLEGVTVESEKKMLLNSIRYRYQLGEQKELVVRATREFSQSMVKSLYFVEWFENEDLLLFCDKIYF